MEKMLYRFTRPTSIKKLQQHYHCRNKHNYKPNYKPRYHYYDKIIKWKMDKKLKILNKKLGINKKLDPNEEKELYKHTHLVAFHILLLTSIYLCQS